MRVPQDHSYLGGSQAFLGQFINLFLHVLRHQLQPCGDAMAEGQALPFPGACMRPMMAEVLQQREFEKVSMNKESTFWARLGSFFIGALKVFPKASGK